MKIRVWSDLHLELAKDDLDPVWTPSDDDKDITLVLAGDIDNGVGVPQTHMRRLCDSFKNVIRICGNHEFYDQEHPRVLDNWETFDQCGPTNFHFLHNRARIIDGVRFFGGTMWTSFNHSDVMVMHMAQLMMNDYNLIRCQGEKIHPHYILKEHLAFMEAFEKTINESYDGKTVVVTHHSPGNPIKRKGHTDGTIDYCYFADLEQMIGENNTIDLWFHGHTHRNWDYMINETRVVCNPYGYRNYSENSNFDKNIIIEL